MEKQPIDEQWMHEALTLAYHAAKLGEVPIGAVVVHEGQIVGRGFNRRESDQDPLAHAEILALREASQYLKRWRLTGCTLYVTLEPCPMCTGALVNARVDRLVYGTTDVKSRINHQVDSTAGVLAEESSAILKAFFQKLRH